ncbi:hypothetical protein GGR55DRAFT_293013 [Xylaria sp. FL0064]|nr:hypothetical protein GGR55DRAFT_293013 [Xylaria sp. FL0064]
MGVDDNPFIRFKNHIDNNLRRGWDIIVGSFPAPPTSSASQPSTSESPTPSQPSTTTSTQSTQSTPPSSSSSWSSKMPWTSSSRTSDATTSDQHTTSPTSPTSPTSSSSHATTTTSATTNSSTTSTSTATIDDVHAWAVHSPYSPLNLNHLHQPTPRDAHGDSADCFTFRDAFEDLLVTGSGYPLPALPWRRLWRFGAGSNSDPFFSSLRRPDHVRAAADWVGPLGLSGLWDAYFDLRTESGRKVRWEDWDRFLKREERYGPFAAVSVPGGLRVGIEGWEGERDRGIAGRARFDAKGIWDSAWRVRGGRWEEVDREEDIAHRDQDRRDGNDADVEDELYGAHDDDPPESCISDLKQQRDMRVTVDVPGGVRTSFPSHPSPSPSSPPSSAPETTTTVYADGSKLVRKVERDERDGWAEVSTTEYYYDAQGNLRSETSWHSVSKTRTWSGSLPGASAGTSFSWSWNSARAGAGDDSSGKERDGDGDGDGKAKKSGWFWRR